MPPRRKALETPTACTSALADVREAAASGANLVPRIINAVEACATVGEIADAMREVFGEYRETSLD